MARSKSQDKRSAIMCAAGETFLRDGFAAASMEAIAAKACVSKATLYSHFSGKAELFKTCVSTRRETAIEAHLHPELLPDDPVTGLQRIAEVFCDLLYSPEVLSLYRLMMAEAYRQPELAKIFIEAGPAPTHRLVAAYLVRLDRLGKLTVPDPEQSAELFLGMLRGKSHALAVLGLPEERPRSQLITAAVQGMVKMCGGVMQ
jgi:TetR/AcrR family transcriptional repressor of mexJK operon